METDELEGMYNFNFIGAHSKQDLYAPPFLTMDYGAVSHLDI